jgi:thiamine transporter
MTEKQLQVFLASTMGQFTTIGFLILIFILITIGFYSSNKEKHSFSKTRALTISALLITLSFVLNQITILKMPQGGSVTLCSMLMIVLVSYLFGTKQGLLAGFAFGILNFIFNPYAVSIQQVLLDYPLAFGALGLGGVIGKQRNLTLNYIIGVVGRFICSFISGVIFFAMYAPEGFSSITWSIVYNGSYLGAEAILTIIVINLAPVKKAIERLGNYVKYN